MSPNRIADPETHPSLAGARSGWAKDRSALGLERTMVILKSQGLTGTSKTSQMLGVLVFSGFPSKPPPSNL
jgi:hypothetical protein